MLLETRDQLDCNTTYNNFFHKNLALVEKILHIPICNGQNKRKKARKTLGMSNFM